MVNRKSQTIELWEYQADWNDWKDWNQSNIYKTNQAADKVGVVQVVQAKFKQAVLYLSSRVLTHVVVT